MVDWTTVSIAVHSHGVSELGGLGIGGDGVLWSNKQDDNLGDLYKFR